MTDTTVRAAADDTVLAAIAGATDSSSPTVIAVPPAELTLHPTNDAEMLISQLATRRSRLQTAVLAVPDDSDASALRALLLDAGCTRVVPPGSAHLPHPDWPHDGIGRFAPLLAQRR